MTAVAICGALCVAVLSLSSASAVFSPFRDQVTPQQTALQLARHECETSLSHSIVKRTHASPDHARALAEQRCDMLFDGAAIPPRSLPTEDT
ncbi:hypothetical protein [Minwuia sp.]|uniref:hypothetical protein n=1 Tax=Minwuia sp. TaxID=2493630 RepID=UPI003A9543C2